MSESSLRLAALERDARIAGEQFMAAHGEEVEAYRKEISTAIDAAGRKLLADVGDITANNLLCTTITKQLVDYVEWLQWSLWDLPYFAVPIGIDRDAFRERLAGCGYVYLAGRVLDDALDRHFSYKSKRATLFSLTVEQSTTAQRADSLAVLSGLLLLGEGLSRLAVPGDEMLVVLQKVLQSFRRAVIGAMMEHTGEEHWDADFYERLIVLKNVDFWRCLYNAVDPEKQSPLYPFLERYYALAQKFNDVLDFPEDLKRGQPNLLTVHLRAQNGNGRELRREARNAAVPPEVERQLADAVLDLAKRAESMPPMEKSVALLKLGESIRSAQQLGLFAVPQPPAAPDEPPAAKTLDMPLFWYSSLDEIIGQWGAGALEDAACEVCGSRERKRIMEQRGFTFHTCLGCTHVYVAPRVRLDLLLEMSAALEHEDEENEFLEIQKIFAEPICHLIRLRAPGNRLLDLGFGRGHIMRMARAYGFEVYGMDSSSYLVEQLVPEFGIRLNRGILGSDEIPWDQFDVVVMSHVVEHLTDPGRILRDVLQKLSPGGILYVAVPDIDSLQFRMFGKHWDAINPLVHMQYFNEASMSRLLQDSGFVNLERIRFPPLPRSMKPKWMQLFRELGGDESGEFAMVAQRPYPLKPTATF
ncbi:MAG TPA: class I SAM-dependent methyltransferase [Thermoanaerobaculia bacterium]